MQDEEAIQKAVAQGFRTICICRGVRQRTIVSAITKGASTLPEIRKKTMAMTGPCGAKRCSGPIKQLLKDASASQRDEATAQPPAPTPPATATAPPRSDVAPPAPADDRSDRAGPSKPRRRRRRRRRGSGGAPPTASSGS